MACQLPPSIFTSFPFGLETSFPPSAPNIDGRHHQDILPMDPQQHLSGSKACANGTAARPGRKENKIVRYRECQRNHAASIGGYAVDGCREFMASGAEGTAAALLCAACGCHRSFHKREVEAECDCSSDTGSGDRR